MVAWRSPCRALAPAEPQAFIHGYTTLYAAAAFAFLSVLLCATQSSSAPACADLAALGVTREITIGDAVAVGLKTYPRTLDLKDHEVVLTFDDGPSRRTTPRVLDALAQACITAEFFVIGRNAAAAPDIVRREVAEGHTVGHHTFSHPAATMRGLSHAAALADIDAGFAADDRAAYGAYSGRPRVPFFRFPGFADTPALLDDLASRDVSVFGADLWASDWVPMTPEAELRLVMGRLDAAGRGIILLHDTKEQTARMLPLFLAALKAGGYHVVHVRPGEGPTETRPAGAGWTSETQRILTHLRPEHAPDARVPLQP